MQKFSFIFLIGHLQISMVFIFPQISTSQFENTLYYALLDPSFGPLQILLFENLCFLMKQPHVPLLLSNIQTIFKQRNKTH